MKKACLLLCLAAVAAGSNKIMATENPVLSLWISIIYGDFYSNYPKMLLSEQQIETIARNHSSSAINYDLISVQKVIKKSRTQFLIVFTHKGKRHQFLDPGFEGHPRLNYFIPRITTEKKKYFTPDTFESRAVCVAGAWAESGFGDVPTPANVSKSAVTMGLKPPIKFRAAVSRKNGIESIAISIEGARKKVAFSRFGDMVSDGGYE